jgi:hypothetical protein
VGAAQFHSPKIPKLDKSQPQPAEQKKEAAALAPELTSISRNSASPGAEGDLALPGKEFNAGTELRMNCGGETPTLTNFKVESETRATVHVRFGLDTREGPCEIYLAQHSASTISQCDITAFSAGVDPSSISQAPQNGKLHFALARVPYLQQEYEPALSKAELAEAAYSDSHLVVLKARILDRMGRGAQALENYRRAQALDPTLRTVRPDIERLEESQRAQPRIHRAVHGC